MVKRKVIEPEWPTRLDIPLVPAVARLPTVFPGERRDLATRHALVRRIHREFEEMPGLWLTPGQAAKLFGLPLDIASRILQRLTLARVLRRRNDGQFALRTENL